MRLAHVSRGFVAAICLTAVLLGLTGVAAAAAPPGLPHTTARLAQGAGLRVSAFGSSSTEGIGASSPAATYPSRLAADLSSLLPESPITVLNRGVGGEDIDDMMRRLPAILAERPDLVIWQTGSNDALRNVPIERFVAKTREGIAAVRAAGADVILMEPQLCRALDAKPSAETFRDAIRTIGVELGVPVIRRYELMQSWINRGLVTRARMMAGDGLHMADAGYALLATEVAHEIVAETMPASRIGAALH